MRQEHFGLTRRDARGRRCVSPIGYAFAGAVLFTLIAAVLLAFARYRSRTLQPVSTPVITAGEQSAPLSSTEQTSIPNEEPVNFTPLEPVETPVVETTPPHPIYWTVHPYELSNGETGYAVDQPEVLEKVKADFLEVFAYTLFSHELPELTELEQALTRLTIDGEARREITDEVTGYYEAGAYWRSAPPRNVSIGDKTISFGADGADVIVSAFFPPGALVREQVDIEIGVVLATEISPPVFVEALLWWDVNQGRWLLVQQKTTYPEQG